jgi:hypothetical protein
MLTNKEDYIIDHFRRGDNTYNPELYQQLPELLPLPAILLGTYEVQISPRIGAYFYDTRSTTLTRINACRIRVASDRRG